MPPNSADFAAHWNPPKRVRSLNMPWLYSNQTEIKSTRSLWILLYIRWRRICFNFFFFSFVFILFLVHFLLSNAYLFEFVAMLTLILFCIVHKTLGLSGVEKFWNFLFFFRHFESTAILLIYYKSTDFNCMRLIVKITVQYENSFFFFLFSFSLSFGDKHFSEFSNQFFFSSIKTKENKPIICLLTAFDEKSFVGKFQFYFTLVNTHKKKTSRCSIDRFDWNSLKLFAPKYQLVRIIRGKHNNYFFFHLK